MIWVGLPYVMRDQIAKVRASRGMWTAAALAGVLYGGALAVFAAIG